jgi:hypothetical protein
VWVETRHLSRTCGPAVASQLSVVLSFVVMTSAALVSHCDRRLLLELNYVLGLARAIQSERLEIGYWRNDCGLHLCAD